MPEEPKDALSIARDALEEIALAGMSGSGQESEEGMRDWHARRAWDFIAIAARAKQAVDAAVAALAAAAASPAVEPATGDVWLRHDEDLRFVNRVLSAGRSMTDADQAAAKQIVHDLRTTARAQPAPTEPPTATAAKTIFAELGCDDVRIRRNGNGVQFEALTPGAKVGVLIHPMAAAGEDPAWAGLQAVAQGEVPAELSANLRTALDITLTEASVAFLLEMMTAPDEPAELRFIVGDGHSGYGLYVGEAEYPEDGAYFVQRLTQPSAGEAEPSDIAFLASQNDQLRAEVARLESELAQARAAVPAGGMRLLLDRWLVYGKAMMASGSTLPRHLISDTETLLAAAPNAPAAAQKPDWRPDSPNLWRTAELQPETDIIRAARNIQHALSHDGPGDVVIALREQLLPLLATVIEECGYLPDLPHAQNAELSEEEISNALEGFPTANAITSLTLDELRELFRRAILATASSADARDAARYRWLRVQHEQSDSAESFCVFEPTPAHDLSPVGSMPGELDEAIDAAIAAEKGGKA